MSKSTLHRVAGIVRSKKPYAELSPRRAWERARLATSRVSAVLSELAIPAASAGLAPPVTPEALVQLPTSTRKQIRRVEGLSIPGEKTIAQTKIRLADEYGTATGSFPHGAYVRDPLLLLRKLTGRTASNWHGLVVGGDCGAGQTKLGVTYEKDGGQMAYVILLVYEAGDNYDSMVKLRQPAVTVFTDSSASHTHIWSVLQALLDGGALLNGDWLFLSAVTAHKGPASSYPCFICNVPKDNLLLTDRVRHRQPGDKFSLDPTRIPLLKVQPANIVPAPLHVFLGIGNRLINYAYTTHAGKEAVSSLMRPLKQLHAAGKGGASDLYGLNGPELHKFIKQKCAEKLADSIKDVKPIAAGSIRALASNFELIQNSLLSSSKFTYTESFSFGTVVSNFQKCWVDLTKDTVFPKLHLLSHAPEFAKRHGYLGRYSEAPMEAAHAQFNDKFHNHHSNMAHQPSERLRRSLADLLLQAAARPALADRTNLMAPTRSASAPARIV